MDRVLSTLEPFLQQKVSMNRINSILKTDRLLVFSLSILVAFHVQSASFSAGAKCLPFYQKSELSVKPNLSQQQILALLNRLPLANEVTDYVKKTNLPFLVSEDALRHIYFGDYRFENNSLVLKGGLHTLEGFQKLLSLQSDLKEHFDFNADDITTYRNGVTAINFPPEFFPSKKQDLRSKSNPFRKKDFFPADWDQLQILRFIGRVYHSFSLYRHYEVDRDHFKIDGSITLSGRKIVNITLIFQHVSGSPKGTKPILITAYPTSNSYDLK
jgi:hypothetical protein